MKKLHCDDCDKIIDDDRGKIHIDKMSLKKKKESTYILNHKDFCSIICLANFLKDHMDKDDWVITEDKI